MEAIAYVASVKYQACHCILYVIPNHEHLKMFFYRVIAQAFSEKISTRRCANSKFTMDVSYYVMVVSYQIIYTLKFFPIVSLHKHYLKRIPHFAVPTPSSLWTSQVCHGCLIRNHKHLYNAFL